MPDSFGDVDAYNIDNECVHDADDESKQHAHEQADEETAGMMPVKLPAARGAPPRGSRQCQPAPVGTAAVVRR